MKTSITKISSLRTPTFGMPVIEKEHENIFETLLCGSVEKLTRVCVKQALDHNCVLSFEQISLDSTRTRLLVPKLDWATMSCFPACARWSRVALAFSGSDLQTAPNWENESWSSRSSDWGAPLPENYLQTTKKVVLRRLIVKHDSLNSQMKSILSRGQLASYDAAVSSK